MNKQEPQKDRHQQSPGEANQDKHVNFEAKETGDPDRSNDDSNKIYFTENSTLQTPEEEEVDKNTPAIDEDDHIRVSNDDLHETPSDRRAGGDRAGTGERKE